MSRNSGITHHDIALARLATGAARRAIEHYSVRDDVRNVRYRRSGSVANKPAKVNAAVGSSGTGDNTMLKEY